MLEDPQHIVRQLRALQRRIRDTVIASRGSPLHHIERATAADTIYALDTLVEPVIEDFCTEWSRTLPILVIAEGLEPATGRTFPLGLEPSEARIRIILDPIDGTRGLMYDKRSAWSLAAAAPNLGPGTSLSDIDVAVMTELPASKMCSADVLWAIRGMGAKAERESVAPSVLPGFELPLARSQATTINHGFASISNFFPGTKVLAAELMEHLAIHLIGPADVTRATLFDDQYISTAGQWYELMVGHDRFNADLRPLFYHIQNQPHGLCVHPYDAAAALIAQEVGVILTDGLGRPLDAPLDLETSLSWCGYANQTLQRQIEPLILQFFASKGISRRS